MVERVLPKLTGRCCSRPNALRLPQFHSQSDRPSQNKQVLGVTTERNISSKILHIYKWPVPSIHWGRFCSEDSGGIL